MEKEQQIEEITKIIEDEYDSAEMTGSELHCYEVAELIYEAGYRKQSEGEWKPYKDYFTKIQVGWICSKCSSVRYNLSDGDTDFCPSCGARMEVGDST